MAVRSSATVEDMDWVDISYAVEGGWGVGGVAYTDEALRSAISVMIYQPQGAWIEETFHHQPTSLTSFLGKRVLGEHPVQTMGTAG